MNSLFSFKKFALAVLTVAACLTLLACQTVQVPVRHQGNMPLQQGWENKTAVVAIAVDLREKTSLRDNIPHFGSIFFRKIDSQYDTRRQNDYDFAIQYNLSASWKSVAGHRDENRTPRLFQIEPGTYVIERIDIGNGPTTYHPGYDSATNRISYGQFTVRAGDAVNLGRLVVHMHYYEGTFSLKVEDNTAELLQFMSESYPSTDTRIQLKLLTVAPTAPFCICTRTDEPKNG